MATVTGFTAERMQDIEDSAIVDGEIVGGNLILTKHDGSTIDAGPVIGPEGPSGPQVIGIPGEIKMWSGETLPVVGTYGHWVWANGDFFNVADHPIAAANISPAWKTAHGLPDPGAGKFRVPDLRGLTPAGLDAMPNGSARANRLTRSVAIVIAGKTGEEVHVITVPEMPVHAHLGDEHWHNVDSHVHNFDENFFSMNSGGGASYEIQKKSMSGGTIQTRQTAGSSAHVTRLIQETMGNINNTGPNGSGSSHENVQPTVFVPYIVKLDD